MPRNPMKTAALILAAFTLAACGSHKAVRHAEPAPTVAEAQTHSVQYQSADGQRIRADYINSNSPMTVELHQGNTVESLKQIQSWTKGVEYSNLATRWHVQEGFATLTRSGKQTVFTEVE